MSAQAGLDCISSSQARLLQRRVAKQLRIQGSSKQVQIQVSSKHKQVLLSSVQEHLKRGTSM
jgi:hypothetical protein